MKSLLPKLLVLALFLPLQVEAKGFSLSGLLPGMGAGMAYVSPTLMVDRAAKPAEIAAIKQRIAAAEQKVGKVFGGLRSRPMWQVCVTEACDRANNITSRATTLGGFLISFSSRAYDDPVTYVHERVHAETQKAEGFAGQAQNLMPNWFDEGMATVISRSVGYPAKRAECRKFADWKLPQTRSQFVALSQVNNRGAGPVYKASACAVLDWLDAGNTPAGALSRLRSGKRVP